MAERGHSAAVYWHLGSLASGWLTVRWLLYWALAMALGVAALGAGAQDVLPVPPLSARVVDRTGTLSAAQTNALEAKLSAFEARKGSQVVVLMVQTTQPEDIASYANRVANDWKIGRRDVGDGVLLVIAKQDRSLRIEVAKALEGAIPDLAAKRIIDEYITPRFKQGDFAGGLEAGVDQLMARISGEQLPGPAPNAMKGSRSDASFEWTDLVIFMLFALPIGTAFARSIFGRKLGAVLVGAGVGALALAVTASLLLAGVAAVIALIYALVSGVASPARGRGWGGGGGGFGSAGGWGAGRGGTGGFGSGGGGDFGGGGASGRW